MNNQIKKTIIFGMALAISGCGTDSGSGSLASLDPRFSKSGSARYVHDPANTMSASDVSSMASGLTISLALSILPPITANTDGTQLYASDLKIVGSRVITGYNVPGAVQKGWLDYVDVTTIAVPLLVDSKYLADTDVNSIAMANGKFAVVGAKDGVGATLKTGTFGLTGLTLNSSDHPLTSYAGTGVAFDSTATNLAVTTGDTGKVSILNATTLVDAGSTDLADARGITYSAATNRYYAVKGQPGGVSSFNTVGAVQASTALGGASIAESKATIVSGSGSFLLATTGDGGFSVICRADMKVAATAGQYIFPNYVAAGLPAPALTVTNAASFGPGMIFTAAGQAGVRVYSFTKKIGISPTACPNVQVAYQGSFEFDKTISVNNVIYGNILTTPVLYTGVLYVAAGAGGFKAVTVVATPNLLNDINEY